MADAEVQLQPDSTGKSIDNTTVTTGAGTVYRQRVSIGDPSANNSLGINASGQLAISNFPATQPVSVATLPALVAGTAVIGHVIVDSGSITDSGSVSVTNFPATQAISAVSLPLPTGAALDSSLATIATDVALQAKLTDTQPVSIAAPVAVTGAFYQGVQPVSGLVDLTGMSLMGVSTLQRARGFEILHPRGGRLRRRLRA